MVKKNKALKKSLGTAIKAIARNKNKIESLSYSAVKGFAVGFNGFYPTLSYKDKDFDAEAGYVNRLGDQIALVKLSGRVWESKQTRLNAGIAVYPGSSLIDWGIYCGVEQQLGTRVSITGEIFPYSAGHGQSIIGNAVVGARFYL